METDFPTSGNHFLPIPQISLLLEADFPYHGKYPLLQPVATDFLFNWNDILSFIFSLKPLEGDQYFKKSYYCWRKPFSLISSDTDSNGNSALVRLNRIFQLILHSG